MSAPQEPRGKTSPQAPSIANAALQRKQLRWLAAGVIVVSGCLLAMALVYMRTQALHAGENLNRSFAQVIQEQTSRTFQSVDQSLELAAITLDKMRWAGTLTEESARQLFRKAMADKPFVQVMWVTDAQGHLMYASDVGHTDTDLSQTGYFKAASAQPHREFLISAPVQRKSDNAWLIPAARPLIATDGSFMGTIAASINPFYFETLWKSIDLGVDGSVALFNRNGTLLMRGPFDEASMLRNFSAERFFSRILPNAASGSYATRSAIDGVSRMFSYQLLSGQPDLVVVVGQSQARILKPWRDLASLTLALWAAASAGILLLSLGLSRAWQQKMLVQDQAAQLTERLRLATDAADIGVWDWDMNGEDQWFASPTYFTMLGYDPEEGFGNRSVWIERLHPDDRLDVEQRIQAVLAGDDMPYRYEARMLHANGHYRWVSVVGRVLGHDKNGKANRMMGIRMDITERKESEEKLRLSEENLRITLLSIGDAVIATDASGNITQMNLSAERLTAWPLADALGQPLQQVFNIIHAHTRESTANPVKLVMEKGDRVGLANHTTLIARDGTEYQIFDRASPIRDHSNHIVGVVLVFNDVTEQYRIREQLASHVKLMERTGAMAKVGGWEVDLKTMQLTWSRQTSLLHDTDPSVKPSIEDAVGYCTPQAQPLVQAAIRAAIDQGTPLNLEVPMVTAKGRHIWMRVNGYVEMENDRPARLLGAVQDITESMVARLAMQQSEARYRALFEYAPDGIVIGDAQSYYLDANASICRMLGYSRDEMIGLHATDIIANADVQLIDAALNEIESHADYHREWQFRRKDGSVFPAEVIVTTMPDGNLMGMIRDITQQRQDEEEIRRLAFYDPLTGLPNRRLLMDRLKQAMTTSARSGKYGSLMFLDLDHFKQLNDTKGHEMGDLLLREVATRLQACVREDDSVARLGGDEFVVLLEGLSPMPTAAATQAELISTKVLDVFRVAFNLKDFRYEGTTSIGIVMFLGDTDAMDDLLKKADVAMYQGKSAGRNTARFFDPAMQAAVEAHDALERDLRRGLAESEFVLYYQTQVDSNGQAVGAEALVRWKHPLHGLVAPIQFIALAEETGLILQLGQWVLEAACAQLVLWAAQASTAHWTVAVNVSASQFAQSDFVANVAHALQSTGAHSQKLKLELTESILVRDVEDVIVKMTAIKALGVGFSLDDFGTGYSSLSYLKRLPLDQLKIDQSFVRDVLTDPSDAVIVRTILALGHSLGLTVIAEGVETEGQRNFLSAAGCDTFQGYYFGRPSPAESFG